MEKLEQFKKKMLAIDSLVLKDDFIRAFKFIIDFATTLKKANGETIQNLKETFAGFMAEMKTDCQGDMGKAKEMMMNYCEKKMNKMMLDHEAMLAEMDKKMMDMSANMPDQAVMASEASRMAIIGVLEQMPKNMPISEEIPIQGDLIADTISGLLEINDIKGLKEELEELRKLRTQRLGGGGFSKIAMDGHIIDAETPTGTINGVNKDFTLVHIPNPTASLKVYRGGARQKLTEDYTLSGKTITFIVAPVAGEIIICDYQI